MGILPGFHHSSPFAARVTTHRPDRLAVTEIRNLSLAYTIVQPFPTDVYSSSAHVATGDLMALRRMPLCSTLKVRS
jgi:hypothetical protein